MAACKPRSSIFYFCRTITLLVIFISFQVDAHSSRAGKEPTWQDGLINWWFSVRGYIATLIIGGLGLSWLIIKITGMENYRSEYLQRKALQENKRAILESENKERRTALSKDLKIFFGTQTGKAKNLAEVLQSKAQKAGLRSEVVDLKNYEPEDNLAEETGTCVFIISTYVDGNPPDSAEWFYKWLEEASNDFRVQKSLLHGLNYAVFGLGNSLYEEKFNLIGRNVDKSLELLSARRVFPYGMGDENVANSKHGGTEEDFKFWSSDFLSYIKGAGEKSKEPAHQCASESNSDDKSCCQSEDGLQEEEIQDGEVKCTLSRKL